MSLQLFETFTAGYELFQRYQKGAAFRGYVKSHGMEIAVAALVLIGISLACTGATIVFLGGRSSWRVFFALVTAPIVLIANFSLLFYVFFSWIEGRAVTTPRPHGKAGQWVYDKLGANLGTPPAIPWLLAGIFLGLPFLMLCWVHWPTAIIVALAAVALPIVYARMDQGAPAKA